LILIYSGFQVHVTVGGFQFFSQTSRNFLKKRSIKKKAKKG
jgi:hypothetical protein